MNTKNLERPARKQAKRVARRSLKELYARMTGDERSKLEQARESKPNLGVKKFLNDLRAKAAAAAKT